ncbi:fn3 and/or zf-C2HC 2 domain containing protein, partial [Asbolus verrucosus]
MVVEYGDPLDITCAFDTGTPMPNASRFLAFRKNDETVSPEVVTMPHSKMNDVRASLLQTEIVNSTTIKLHIDKPNKVSADLYTCLMNNTPVSLNFVTVGTKPQAVEDFNCISYNFDNLCSWTPPENYVKTNYHLTYTLRDTSSRRGHNEYFFTLKMENVFGEISTTFQNFAHGKCRKVSTQNLTNLVFPTVLPEPPENLTVISTTSSSVYLRWQLPESMQIFTPGVHHRIFYQSEYDGKQWSFGGEITDNATQKEKFFNLTNLQYAHALYDIRVSLRSADAIVDDESTWSRHASVTIRTDSKVPDEPPKTIIGGFELLHFGDDLQFGEVYIYWQQIPKKKRNGPDFRYKISVEANPALQPSKLTDNYAKFDNLSILSSHMFHIWSENARGLSLEKSIIMVPSHRDLVEKPKNFAKVDYGGGRYELCWKTPKIPPFQHLQSYTIFWCEDKRERPHQCGGRINWRVIPLTTRTQVSVAKDGIFQFAVSANTGRSSSGMLWAPCTGVHDKNMYKIKNLQLKLNGLGYTELQWTLKRDNCHCHRIVGFIVHYCQMLSLVTLECRGGNITDLSHDTLYKFTVAVRIENNLTGQQTTGDVDFVGTFHRIWDNHLAELTECSKCGRKFFPHRIEAHRRACAGLRIELKNKK